MARNDNLCRHQMFINLPNGIVNKIQMTPATAQPTHASACMHKHMLCHTFKKVS